MIILPVTTYIEFLPYSSFIFFNRLWGRMAGVEDLYIRGFLTMDITGSSSCDTLLYQGQYWIRSLTVLRGGYLRLVNWTAANADQYTLEDKVLTLHMETLELQHESYLDIRSLAHIKVQKLEVELEAGITGIHGRITYKMTFHYSGGHPPDKGPGAGCVSGSSCYNSAGGGGYGGDGAGCEGARYGIPQRAMYMGSGGATCHGLGGYGGAGIRLSVSELALLEGEITMTGQDGEPGGGGGSGGSIWLDADILEGWGHMIADGGHGYRYDFPYSDCYCRGGGGGGGRIRTYTPISGNKVALHHRVAQGGTGYSTGQAGTIFTAGVETNCSLHMLNAEWSVSNQRCECADGYYGQFCQYSCDPTVHCNGNGVCDASGKCECNQGYAGYHCQQTCSPDIDCGSNGKCSFCGTCVCDPCYHGNDCSQLCSNHGNCDGQGHCMCDPCHSGHFCQVECSGHGSCGTVAGGEPGCQCEEGWRGDLCDIAGCPGEEEDCSGHGLCNAATHQCMCYPGWAG